ncbi:hypothetical protein BGZ96_007324 [Linnemannia gamsii]|uniref:Uncharacterized protein n=1 Tax=Linnemannia gamsii TaxID=64522 RepID=A0ABQ7K1M1_9FUNG|nr:hypothetical protein BGZ96_007324 [Linnemannia gamsii]
MPSIINTTTNNHFSSTPSELDLLSDSAAAATSTIQPSLRSNNNENIQELKDRERRRRRQWLEPEDEFSVPIHTESPLITKSPLDMSSFLLNYRAMRRSVEIMMPPPSSVPSKNHEGLSSTPLHPTLPDGPIYIHHRSTLAESPLLNVLSSCAHLQCSDYNYPYNPAIPSSNGPDCRMSRVLSNSAQQQQQQQQQQPAGGALVKENQQHRYHNYTQDTSSPQSITPRSSDSATGEHSFLESHIASISQWLTSNAV